MFAEKIYLENIIGENEESFLNVFKKLWATHIETFPEKYRKGKQLLIGSRFRPVLVCWGYALAGKNLDLEKKRELAYLSLYIELMHKATLLIDDLIDNDISRHGEESFHIQFSDNEAIIFSIYLFGDSLEQLSKSLLSVENKDTYFDILNLYSTTIKAMTEGVLTELSLDTNELTSIKAIKKIIEQQTVSIIKNGLLIGYKYGDGNKELYNSIDNIGYDCGYIFQVLNDLEPFGSIKINTEHKGKSNIDIIRLRKNIVVAFIYNNISNSEKKVFDELIRDEKKSENEIFEYTFSLFKKYNILDRVIDNLSDVKDNINSNLEKAETQIYNNDVIIDFKFFLNFILKEAIKKVGIDYHKKLSDILIM